jgi:hypothetical protein
VSNGRQQVVIWGKTYPELSRRHRETVCTGACILATGQPIRLYPIALRYLERHHQYRLYDIVELPIGHSSRDTRPESRKVKSAHLEVVGHLGSADGWLPRHRVIFKDPSWHYDCLAELEARSKRDRSSLGLIPVRSLDGMEVVERSVKERDAHDAKLKELAAQGELFAPAMKTLEFFPYKMRVRYRCRATSCPGHDSLMLDWGLGEMARREGIDTAVRRMESLGDVDRYDLRFFVGNFKAHPQHFGVVAAWYPLRAKLAEALVQGDLF